MDIEQNDDKRLNGFWNGFRYWKILIFIAVTFSAVVLIAISTIYGIFKFHQRSEERARMALLQETVV